ncbi:MAG TPA: D-glycero-beta-D-manno-heptose 1-phosphate adenylyltransferase [Dehalococcoidia bacterium]|nr:D-glycero-beta-D-manno-heptose 1-phosphate adenylyltransferase [Dehalococcoidia bacterium]
MGEVRSLPELRSIRERLRAGGRLVVFTNGCFDLIHSGHVRYLAAARALGDHLIVGLNSDDSVRRLKGAGRPILPAEDRADILAALRAVDYVVVFDDDTAEPLVAALQPDIYVKGGDYRAGTDGGKPLPEAAIVARYGGRVELVDLHAGRSTTDIIRTVLERYGG